MSGNCEWNPVIGAPSCGQTDDPRHDAEAVWAIGKGRNNWHLCDDCSKLPRFKRLTRRSWIGPEVKS